MEADEVVIRTTAVVSTYVSHNSLPVADLPALIGSVHAALSGLGRDVIHEAPEAGKAVGATPAQIRKSITPDHLFSFEDGKPYQILRRHLRKHGLSPEAYRKKWGLPPDYPMVAETYSARRADIARGFDPSPLRQRAVPESGTVRAKTAPSAEHSRRKPRAA